MRLFKGPEPDRDVMACLGIPIDLSEMDRLEAILDRNGVQFERVERGPYSGIAFECPHGVVNVAIGPGSIGAEKGLLEASCDTWDLSPRGNLTARGLYMTYMYGGW